MADTGGFIEQLLTDLLGPEAAQLERGADGQILMSAAEDPAMLLILEPSPGGDRLLMRAVLGSLPDGRDSTMLRALLQANLGSAILGGPSLTLEPDSDSVVAVRSFARRARMGEDMTADHLALILSEFTAQSLWLKSTLEDGRLRALADPRDDASSTAPVSAYAPGDVIFRG